MHLLKKQLLQNCSGTAWEKWHWAQGADLTSKSLRSQSNQASCIQAPPCQTLRIRSQHLSVRQLAWLCTKGSTVSKLHLQAAVCVDRACSKPLVRLNYFNKQSFKCLFPIRHSSVSVHLYVCYLFDHSVICSVVLKKRECVVLSRKRGKNVVLFWEWCAWEQAHIASNQLWKT